MNRETLSKGLHNLALLFLMMFAAPLAISILLLQANWREIAIGFGAWWVILFVFLGSGRSRPRMEEIIGWMMIFTMFTGWLAVPLLVVAQRLLP